MQNTAKTSIWQRLRHSIIAVTALSFCLSLQANQLPQIPPQQVNNTMYQAFYWDAYPGLWANLPTMAAPLAERGITSIWLPPAAKGMNGTNSVGYDVYDFWDLGEFNQKGTIATRYGSRAQLQQALSALDQLGIQAYFDVVFNHRMGADVQENIPGFGLDRVSLTRSPGTLYPAKLGLSVARLRLELDGF